MHELFLFSMLIGSIAGFLAGLFGLGGGVLIVPALAWLFSVYQFPGEHIMIMAVATSLASIILTSISAIISHHKLGAIVWDSVFRLTPGILIGAGLGATLANFVTAGVLRWFFISYLIFVGIRMAFQFRAAPSKKSAKKWLDYVAGSGIGLLSSLLGIGGGTLTVPYLAARRFAMKNAVAISSACGLPIALSGSTAYVLYGEKEPLLPEWSFGYVYLPALGGIIVCSILTAPFGALLANKLPSQQLKRYFSIVVFLIAFKMMVV